MFRLIWRASTAVRDYLQTYMPTNILLARMRDPVARRRAWPVVGGLIPVFLLGAYLATAAISNGGPEWLYVLVAIWIWNAMKHGWATGIALLSAAGRLGNV